MSVGFCNGFEECFRQHKAYYSDALAGKTYETPKEQLFLWSFCVNKNPLVNFGFAVLYIVPFASLACTAIFILSTPFLIWNGENRYVLGTIAGATCAAWGRTALRVANVVTLGFFGTGLHYLHRK